MTPAATQRCNIICDLCGGTVECIGLIERWQPAGEREQSDTAEVWTATKQIDSAVQLVYYGSPTSVTAQQNEKKKRGWQIPALSHHREVGSGSRFTRVCGVLLCMTIHTFNLQRWFMKSEREKKTCRLTDSAPILP